MNYKKKITIISDGFVITIRDSNNRSRKPYANHDKKMKPKSSAGEIIKEGLKAGIDILKQL